MFEISRLKTMGEVINGLQCGPSVVIEHTNALKIATQLLKSHWRMSNEKEKASELTTVYELMETKAPPSRGGPLRPPRKKNS